MSRLPPNAPEQRRALPAGVAGTFIHGEQT